MPLDNENAADDFDLTQEIARSGFADMLHDTDRNRRYKQALKSVIDEKHERDELVHVVDIGTGTGLLSLMAAEAGADRVTAVEAFMPAADVARRIFDSSVHRSKIDLISSRSTDLRKGAVTQKGNVIVAEVFDTELIGEGALRTFKEALETLVQPGCRVIPSSAKVFVMPVQSELLRKFNKLPSILQRDANCDGTAAVFDVQLSAFDKTDVVAACDPFVAFSFNFENSEEIVYDESVVREAIVQHHETLKVDAVLMWWDLDMDGSGKNIVSTAPSWIDDGYQWRDHWMQAVYFLPKPLTLGPGDRFMMRCSHDEFSLWFHAAHR
ncbi:CRE-PRMT-2 protein [Aphelenchoides avenae]|nr:CRE-PRMT-2 protein [Aphelenchus avenae]